MTRPNRSLAILTAGLLAAPGIALANETVQPPAAPAPLATPGSEESLPAQLADARRDVLEAERQLRDANAALARASRREQVRATELERLAERQARAERAFETARERVPELLEEARAAGVSASALRSYEHSLYGD